MDDNMIQAQTDQQLRDQQMMNESSRWFNDPVNRDMIYGDWKSDRSRKSTRNGVLALLVFILFTIAFILIFYNYSH
jgi:hypothetical protein